MSRWLLCLDFDGTLTPIVRHPKDAYPDKRVLAFLRQGVRDKDITIAVISGRSLKDLKTRVGVPGVIYVGNHGLEMAGLRLPSDARKALRCRRSIHLLYDKLTTGFQTMPGVLIEDKMYGLSIHYRNLDSDMRPIFDSLIGYYRNKFRRHPIRWRRGKKVWEVLPSVEWNKGDAVKALLKAYPGCYPVAIGDDVTDEDMFRALRKNGLTVRVGFSKSSCAQHFLKAQKDLLPFLERLCSS